MWKSDLHVLQRVRVFDRNVFSAWLFIDFECQVDNEGKRIEELRTEKDADTCFKLWI